MPVDKIQYTDSLRVGTDKLNTAIEQANVAEEISKDAKTKSDTAVSASNKAFVMVDDIVKGAISTETLNTNIEQRLLNLETQYTPKLTEVTEKVEQSAKNSVPRKHVFGGQIEKLKNALSNPFVQHLGIVFLGDSITWGRTLPENGVFDPRDGTLSDPRDVFASPSYVNEVKRYIGSQYANGVSPVLSNWSASPSGQSIAEYTVQHILYPKDGDFALTSTGPSVNVTEVQAAASLTGYQLRLTDANIAGTSFQSVKFNFTGKSFTLSFACLESEATYYDLYVDSVKVGTYSTHAGVGGFVDGKSDNRRKHTFPYVKGKVVEIRTNRNGENTGNRRLRLEAIIIDKVIRISNQGINGASARSHTLYNLTGNTYGDGEAVGNEDYFTFVQLGTNDRLNNANVPKGSNAFKVNLNALISKITPLTEVILMCANPATEGASYSFTMQEARNTIYRTAKESSIDMIDNYAIFEGLDMSKVTADGVHPNKIGHQIIARNIINSIES